MDKKVRLIAGGLFVSIIVIMGIIIFINKDTIFNQEIEIVFGDGCVEKYINGELITPECTEARAFMKEQENQTINYGVDITQITNGNLVPAWDNRTLENISW